MRMSEKSHRIINQFYRFQETGDEKLMNTYSLKEIKLAKLEFQKEKGKNSRSGFPVIDELLGERIRKLEKIEDENKKRQERVISFIFKIIAAILSALLIAYLKGCFKINE